MSKISRNAPSGCRTENYEIQSHCQIMELGRKQRSGHYGNAQPEIGHQ